MVDEKDAVEMVDFVEEGTGEVARGLEADFGAVFKESFNFNLMWAADESINLGDGEAAFLIFVDFALGADDFGVDKGSEMLVVFIVEVVTDDDNALILAHLRGGHSGRKFVRVLSFPSQGSGAHVGD